MQDMGERKSITKELIEIIKASDIISQFKIAPGDIRIGVFYTGVVLSSGHAGMSYTPVQEIPEAVCCPRSHAKMPAAGELLNLQIAELMDYALNDNALKAAVGIATINALSAISFEDAAKMIHLIGEAGSGYDFFENCAEKVIIKTN